MDSLVLNLQEDALNSTSSVTQLLRKARALSVKLVASQLDEWISCELNGYAVDKEVPSYRVISGLPKVVNPFHGLQPLHVADSETAHMLSTQFVKQSTAELESLRLGEGALHMQFPNALKMSLMRQMQVAMEPILAVQPASIVGILDAVRNTILDWTLELEQQGVLGEGLVFSAADRKNAETATYNITNNIGSMHGSQLQQVTKSSSQKISNKNELGELKAVLSDMRKDLNEIASTDSMRDTVSAEISTIVAQASSPEPRYGIIEESLNSIKTILEAAAGNVIAAGYLAKLGGIV